MSFLCTLNTIILSVRNTESALSLLSRSLHFNLTKLYVRSQAQRKAMSDVHTKNKIFFDLKLALTLKC